MINYMERNKKQKSHLLIVDDERELVSMLRELLQGQADQISFAHNGFEAYQMIKMNQYDAILSDINMPKMNGLELLAQIRRDEIMVPFIVLSGFGDERKTIEALNNGAMDFIHKPWKQDYLEQVLSRALEIGLEMKRWQQEGFILRDIEDLRKFTAEQAIEILMRKDL